MGQVVPCFFLHGVQPYGKAIECPSPPLEPGRLLKSSNSQQLRSAACCYRLLKRSTCEEMWTTTTLIKKDVLGVG